MSRILVALFITFALGTAIADEISVTEFVSGTTISSSDMNQNFRTLVEESNENDDRISVLESASGQNSNTGGIPTQLVWVDARGQVVGTFFQFIDGAGMLVKYPESDRVFSILSTATSNGPLTEEFEGQQFVAYSVFYSDPNCTGDAFFRHYGSGGSNRIRGSQGILNAGVDMLGNAVLPDFASAPVRGPSADPIAQSYSTLEADGSPFCKNQEIDYETQSWIRAVSTTTPITLGIELPVRLEWR